MPNEVWNKLIVEGPEDDVERFATRVVSKEIDKYTGEPYILDFEAHVPIPEDVTDLTNWVISAWGCKQPLDPRMLERNPGRVVYWLITAAGIPDPWVKATAAEEPTLSFVHEWMDEFGDGWGRMHYKGGEFVRDDDIEPTDLEWVTWDEDDD